MFNMDETGISSVPNKIHKVNSPSEKRIVSKVVWEERGQTITAVCCMNHFRFSVKAVIIFLRNRIKPYPLKHAPEVTVPMLSDSGFINKEIFFDWLKHV